MSSKKLRREPSKNTAPEIFIYADIVKTTKYDAEKDVFYDLQPFPSWTLNQTSFLWEPPVPYPNPDEGVYKGWNESTLSWEREPT